MRKISYNLKKVNKIPYSIDTIVARAYAIISLNPFSIVLLDIITSKDKT